MVKCPLCGRLLEWVERRFTYAYWDEDEHRYVRGNDPCPFLTCPYCQGNLDKFEEIWALPDSSANTLKESET